MRRGTSCMGTTVGQVISDRPYYFMECVVAEVHTVHATPAAFKKVDRPIQESHEEYTPGDFLQQFSTVVAICLGLAALAHLVVFMVGN
jgi:hypothetical protein